MKKKTICWQIKELLIGFIILLAFMCLFTFCAKQVEARDLEAEKFEQFQRHIQQSYAVELDGFIYIMDFTDNIFGPAQWRWDVVFSMYDSDGVQVIGDTKLGEIVYQNGCAILMGDLKGCIPVFGYGQFRIYCNPVTLNAINVK